MNSKIGDALYALVSSHQCSVTAVRAVLDNAEVADMAEFQISGDCEGFADLFERLGITVPALPEGATAEAEADRQLSFVKQFMTVAGTPITPTPEPEPEPPATPSLYQSIANFLK